jgi:hypothetical protein
MKTAIIGITYDELSAADSYKEITLSVGNGSERDDYKFSDAGTPYKDFENALKKVKELKINKDLILFSSSIHHFETDGGDWHFSTDK